MLYGVCYNIVFLYMTPLLCGIVNDEACVGMYLYAYITVIIAHKYCMRVSMENEIKLHNFFKPCKHTYTG